MTNPIPSTAPVLCTVYRSNREAGLYVYVRRAEGLERVPIDLLTQLGPTSEVLTLQLTADRKLARVRATDVLAALAEKGYYLQIPPDFNPARFSLGG
jgi:uncharacterized protein YcgL (UPF0745 family)